LRLVLCQCVASLILKLVGMGVSFQTKHVRDPHRDEVHQFVGRKPSELTAFEFPPSVSELKPEFAMIRFKNQVPWVSCPLSRTDPEEVDEYWPVMYVCPPCVSPSSGSSMTFTGLEGLDVAASRCALYLVVAGWPGEWHGDSLLSWQCNEVEAVAECNHHR
jgi:hypothetical protein